MQKTDARPRGRVWMCIGWDFVATCLGKSMRYRLQYGSHDQTGVYQPPVFFGRLLLELEASGGYRVFCFCRIELHKRGIAANR